MAQEQDFDIRSAIEAAVTEVEEPSEATTAPETPPESQEPPTPAPESAPPTPSEPPAATPPADPATPTPTDSAATPPEAAKPPADPPPPTPDAKAPGTWTPGAREKWATLPNEVKQEVWKREREASRALTMSTEARKFADQFGQTMQPYLGFIAAEKSTPIEAVANMMQTAAALRVGTPQQKVQIVAEVIRNFGVDLGALDSVLAGQRPEFNPMTQIDQIVNQRLAPVMQMVEQQNRNRQFQEQQFEQQVQTELTTFANDPKHEFYSDVQDVMADLMEVSHRRGAPMGLTEAYERATLLHEPVRRVIEARKQRESAQQATQQARQAKGNAVSITPSAEASNVVPVVGDSVRASIEAAFNAQQGR